MRTANLDAQKDVFAIVKSILFQCFGSVHYQCNFSSGIALCALLKISFAVQKLNCFG